MGFVGLLVGLLLFFFKKVFWVLRFVIFLKQKPKVTFLLLLELGMGEWVGGEGGGRQCFFFLRGVKDFFLSFFVFKAKTEDTFFLDVLGGLL